MPHKARAKFEWSRALIALALTLVVWLVVHAEEQSTGWVPVDVGLTLDPATTLDAPITPVLALVSGKRRDLFKLLSAPPSLQRAVTSAAGDSAWLELRVQDVDLPLESNLTVRDIRPRLLRVKTRSRGTPEPLP